MKKIFILLVVACACIMSSCGNTEVDKINELVITATAQTKAATSIQEVGEIATSLQTEMDRISAEAGGKVSFGKSVDEALSEYQAAAAAKLAEFGLVLE